MSSDPDVDWVSITDNAGGNPQLAPHALGKPILYTGKEVVIHLSCKDLNRNGLESQAWFLNGEGFHNILALTGDYPQLRDALEQGRAQEDESQEMAGFRQAEAIMEICRAAQSDDD